MFPWTPPLWLTVAFIATAIAINLITIISKKITTKRINDEQNSEPYTKDAAYWTHVIASRIANIVNIVAGAVIIGLLLWGMGWLCNQHPYIFWAMICVFMWIASLSFVQVFFINTKYQDIDEQENDTLIDPNDRHAVNTYVAWVLINIAIDTIMWLAINTVENMHYQ